ncbi:hypothetical protein HPB49_002836 [Dermacentor silvarum]|uniref:Uncharacterized protein n=1 Tax=Dermacentor silvarum TaxID=543639 RepID=A0ACB8CP50_DERSI|nr:hypothetical protein HPB49_002836 [Dermacentor silvarum]
MARVASVDNHVVTMESHLTALYTMVAVLEARQSSTEATLAHLLVPAPLTPPSDPFSGRRGCHIHTPCSTTLHHGRQPSTAPLGGPSQNKLTRAILTPHLTKAFDNAHHTIILDALSSLYVGPHVHAYVTAFLALCAAEISYGPLSSPFSLDNKGTPQGCLLCLMLSTPMTSRLLVTAGNLGDMETTLQAGADAVVTHALSVGLSCFPAK